jgi:hypothetical protein
VLGLLVLGATYLVLLCNPGVFFRYSFTHGGMAVFSDEPIPASARRVIELAESRLAQSPVLHGRAARTIRIYICNRKWRFILFANTRYKVGGIAYAPLTNNVFLRGAHFDSNRLVGPSGGEVPGERTLTYYIAHEVMHTVVADHLSVVAHWRLPAWKNEGYADYVAKGSDFDYDQVVLQFRRGARELDPARSGLYLRYHLLVAYLLDKRRIGVHRMLAEHFDQAELEAEIRTGGSRGRESVERLAEKSAGPS